MTKIIRIKAHEGEAALNRELTKHGIINKPNLRVRTITSAKRSEVWFIATY